MPRQYPAWGIGFCVVLILSSITTIPITVIIVKLGAQNLSKEKSGKSVMPVTKTDAPIC